MLKYLKGKGNLSGILAGKKVLKSLQIHYISVKKK